MPRPAGGSPGRDRRRAGSRPRAGRGRWSAPGLRAGPSPPVGRPSAARAALPQHRAQARRGLAPSRPIRSPQTITTCRRRAGRSASGAARLRAAERRGQSARKWRDSGRVADARLGAAVERGGTVGGDARRAPLRRMALRIRRSRIGELCRGSVPTTRTVSASSMSRTRAESSGWARRHRLAAGAARARESTSADRAPRGRCAGPGSPPRWRRRRRSRRLGARAFSPSAASRSLVQPPRRPSRAAR